MADKPGWREIPDALAEAKAKARAKAEADVRAADARLAEVKRQEKLDKAKK